MLDTPKSIKPTSGYHFSSAVQDSIDGEVVQNKILDTLITLPLRDILGTSADMQKRFTNLTKTRRDYVSKLGESNGYETDADSGDDAGQYRKDHQPYNTLLSQQSENDLQLSYDETEDVNAILTRYVSAIKVNVSPLFAMTTGRFEGTLGNKNVTFMVDTGSELNLISDSFYRTTSMPLDLDGSRWSLKGINGGPVPLMGCVRDAPVSIGGHRFDHHFFVSSEGAGRQDVILGQPWLQWYSANISYTPTGSVKMRVWKRDETGLCQGDENHSNQKATVLIQLCNANESRNQDRLVLHTHASNEEFTDDESEK